MSRLRIRWADGIRAVTPLGDKDQTPIVAEPNEAAQARVAAALKRMGLVAGDTDPDGWTAYVPKPRAGKPKPAPHVCAPCPTCIPCVHPTGRLWTWSAFDGSSVTACLACRRLVATDLDPSARSEAV